LGVVALGRRRAPICRTPGGAIEYVRICDAYARIFSYPGTDTCLRSALALSEERGSTQYALQIAHHF